MKQATKIYTRDFVISWGLYLVTMFIIHMVLEIEQMPTWQSVPIVLVPIIPLCLGIRAELIFRRSQDELQKQMMMEATIISFYMVGVGSFSYSYLQDVGFPELNVVWILPALMVTQGISTFFVMRKYK